MKRNFKVKYEVQRNNKGTNMPKWIKYTLLFTVVLVISGSCKTGKYIGKPPGKGLSAEQIVKINKENQRRHDRVWIKKLRGVYFNENEELKFNSNIRIIKDSVIIISIGVDFGIEALRVYIEKDTVTIINRFHKTWYANSNSELTGKYELINNYSRLEELLLMGTGDEVLLEQNGQINDKLKEEGYCYILKSVNKKLGKEIYKERICFDLITGYLKERTIISENNDYEFRIEYSKYKEMSLSVLPTEIDARLNYRGSEHRLLMYYDKWVTNEEFSTKLRISSSYKRVNRLIDL